MTGPAELTDVQAARLAELADVLREHHGDAVQVEGSRVYVRGSNLAADVEADGGLWRTWADGTRAYEAPPDDDQAVRDWEGRVSAQVQAAEDAGHMLDPADAEPHPAATRARLEYLRGQLRAECISMGELVELQGLAEHIDPGDVELLEAAGVPEFPDDPDHLEA